MRFTADGKRQRLPLIFYSTLVILKLITQKYKKMSPTIHRKYKDSHSTVQIAEDRRQKFHFCHLPFDGLRHGLNKVPIWKGRGCSSDIFKRTPKTYQDPVLWALWSS